MHLGSIYLVVNDFVRKGYGWMLKILSTKAPELVFTKHFETK